MRKSLLSFALVLSTVALVVLSACKSGPKDADLEKTVTEKISAAASDITGGAATVKDGVVTLSGEFKDAASKDAFDMAVKAIPGVKSVVNNTTVAPPPPAPVAAPVVVAADDPLTKAVTDAIKDYPGVKAEVKDGVITLSGEIKKADNRKLMPILQALKPKSVDSKNLTIK